MGISEKIESLLFVSGEPLNIDIMARFFKLKRENLILEVEKLRDNRQKTGINIKFLNNDSVQLVSNPNNGEEINNFFNPESKPKKLTKASMETLAIIAYKQPITKSEIESIRGVKVEKVVSSLEEKGLIRICGKKDTSGNPNLYSVSDDFYSYMGIKKIEELPNYGKK